jgi:hypothetical protein
MLHQCELDPRVEGASLRPGDAGVAAEGKADEFVSRLRGTSTVTKVKVEMASPMDTEVQAWPGRPVCYAPSIKYQVSRTLLLGSSIAAIYSTSD